MSARDDIDFPRSRAILLGTSVYTPGFGSRPMPAASNSLAAMRAALEGPCCWPGPRIEEFPDKGIHDSVLQEMAPLIHETKDVLLLYYVGHGQLLLGNDLGLALTDTSEDPKLRLSTSLRLSHLRQEIQHNCDARIKIVILDCCCSGIATKYSQGPHDLAAQVQQAAKLEGEGTYTWTACGHSQDAFFEPGKDGVTYFTKFLAETAQNWIRGRARGLTLTDFHKEVNLLLQQAYMPDVPVKPEPTLLFHGSADGFVFARNNAPAADQAMTQSTDPQAVAAVITARQIAIALALALLHAVTSAVAAATAQGQARDLARDLARERDADGRLARAFHRASDRVSDQARTLASKGANRVAGGLARDRDRALDRARDLADDLATATARARQLDYDRDRALVGASSRARDLANILTSADLRDLANATARALANTHFRGVSSALQAVQMDASGLDLSGLDGMELGDLTVLVGVIWTEETIWPLSLAEPVRQRSHEIRPGVYQVSSDTEGDRADPLSEQAVQE